MKRLALIIWFVVSAGLAIGQTSYFNSNGVAINGYDPVAYFTDNAAVEGSKEFTYSWEGTEWHFKNQANLNSFKANPAKYAPQYGGYCAYGVSDNHLSPTRPEAFTVLDNKLYLNYNPKVMEMWRKDTKGFIEKAEKYWPELQTPHSNYNLEKGLAIQGYDPVAYFAGSKAVKGKKEFSHSQNGATYYFSSAANKDTFIKNPVAYEPQYGGWCAYAMGATGEKVEIDPETFKIVDKKLYLFYNAFFNNTLPKWNSAEADLKTKADKNWKAINK